jgi:hypothetical protein
LLRLRLRRSTSTTATTAAATSAHSAMPVPSMAVSRPVVCTGFANGFSSDTLLILGSEIPPTAFEEEDTFFEEAEEELALFDDDTAAAVWETVLCDDTAALDVSYVYAFVDAREDRFLLELLREELLFLLLEGVNFFEEVTFERALEGCLELIVCELWTDEVPAAHTGSKDVQHTAAAHSSTAAQKRNRFRFSLQHFTGSPPALQGKSFLQIDYTIHLLFYKSVSHIQAPGAGCSHKAFRHL